MHPRLHASCPCRTRPCMHPSLPCMHPALPACLPREVALGGQSSALTLRGGSARHASTRGAGGECGGLRPSPLLPALAASPESEAFHSTSAESPCRGRPPCIATCHNQTHSGALRRTQTHSGAMHRHMPCQPATPRRLMPVLLARRRATYLAPLFAVYRVICPRLPSSPSLLTNPRPSPTPATARHPRAREAQLPFVPRPEARAL